VRLTCRTARSARHCWGSTGSTGCCSTPAPSGISRRVPSDAAADAKSEDESAFSEAGSICTAGPATKARGRATAWTSVTESERCTRKSTRGRCEAHAARRTPQIDAVRGPRRCRSCSGGQSVAAEQCSSRSAEAAPAAKDPGATRAATKRRRKCAGKEEGGLAAERAGRQATERARCGQTRAHASEPSSLGLSAALRMCPHSSWICPAAPTNEERGPKRTTPCTSEKKLERTQRPERNCQTSSAHCSLLY
jgi:hypothetical protein